MLLSIYTCFCRGAMVRRLDLGKFVASVIRQCRPAKLANRAQRGKTCGMFLVGLKNRVAVFFAPKIPALFCVLNCLCRCCCFATGSFMHMKYKYLCMSNALTNLPAHLRHRWLFAFTGVLRRRCKFWEKSMGQRTKNKCAADSLSHKSLFWAQVLGFCPELPETTDLVGISLIAGNGYPSLLYMPRVTAYHGIFDLAMKEA